MTDPIPKSRNWPRRLLIALLLAIFILVIALAAARNAMRSSWGHNFVERKIESIVPAGQSIELSTIEGDLLGRFTIAQLSISDSEKTWLDIKNLEVSWSPWSLLSRKVVIDNLSTSTVSIYHRPVLIASDEPLNVPFESYVLNALNIPSLSIAEDIIGRNVTLKARGKANHGPMGGAILLDGKTLDASVKDSAEIDLKWSPEFLLRGNAKIIGESGGLISSLLNLGTQDIIRLDIKTRGDQQNLTTTIDGRLGELSFVTGEIRRTEDTAEVSAKLSPKIIPKLESFNDILGGDLNLFASVNELSKDAVITAKMTAPKFGAVFTAAKSKNGYIFPDLMVTAKAPLSTVPDIPAAIDSIRLTGSGKWEGPLSFTGRIDGTSMKYDDYILSSIQGPLEIKLNGTLLDFNTELIGKIPDDASPKLIAQGQYSFENKRLLLNNSNINIPGLKASAKGSASLTAGIADMSGSFDVSKNVLGTTLPASFKGTFQTKTVSGNIALDVTGKARDFEAFPAPLPLLIGEELAFALNTIIEAENGITLKNFSATGDDLSVTGKGQYNFDKTLRADVKYQAGGFTVGTTNLTSLDGEATVSGSIGTLNFDVSTHSPEIKASGRTVSNLALTAKGKQQNGAINAALNLDGDSAQGPISLTADAAYADGAWQASNMTAFFGDLNVTGDLSGVGGDITQLIGDLKVNGNPSQFIPATSVELDVKLSNRIVDANGVLGLLSVGPLSDGKVTLAAAGPRDAVKFKMGVIGKTLIADINRDLDMQISGIADTAFPLASVTSELSGNLGQYKLMTTAPLSIAQTANGLRGNGSLNLFDGTLSFTLNDQPQSLNLMSENLRLADIMVFMGRAGVEGRAAFAADLQASGSGFEGDFSGNLTGMRQPGSDAEVLEARLKGQLQNGVLNLRAESTSGALSGETQLNGTVSTLMKPPFIDWPPSTPLIGDAKAKGDIGSLMDLFLPPETNFSGNLNLDMQYSLPIDARGINGTMSMTEGRFEQGSIGLTLKDMTSRSVFNGTTISVAEFSANDSKGGSLTGNGKMDIGFVDGSAITLAAKGLHIFNRREGFAVLSGDLKLNHTGEKLALKGGLIVDDASISIDKFPSAGRPTLDVKFSDAEDDEDKIVRTATELDVKITSPSRIKLMGRGVNATMSIDTLITGAFNDPVLAGEAEITRGRFDFLGKRFALNNSKIIFNDQIMESRLDVAAIRETSDLTATVNVTGTLSRPEIAVESSPQLPEDEVISRILFGRSASQLTTIETARLAAALAQLSGGGGFDLLGGLENALGLDTLDFGQSDTGQTQVTTGKYLSDNVYVEVRGSAEGTPGLAVEWTPRRNISIEAETAPGETQRVSVQWQKDFD